jgi:hypothetical protein
MKVRIVERVCGWFEIQERFLGIWWHIDWYFHEEGARQALNRMVLAYKQNQAAQKTVRVVHEEEI